MRLQNTVIIITGSTTGIGKAIAIKCVAEGAKVVIHGLEEAWGKEVVEQLGAENAVLYIEDLANDGAAERLIDVALREFGKLDAIVNNAAIVASSNLETTDKAFMQRLLTVNTIAPF
jgi:NAD(P)-dependent dehydrogenase (short-subunit alcohol dehydrogenase family)